jgi:hypothetical protein
VVSTPLKNRSSSVGDDDSSHILWKIQNVPNHQPGFSWARWKKKQHLCLRSVIKLYLDHKNSGTNYKGHKLLPVHETPLKPNLNPKTSCRWGNS